MRAGGDRRGSNITRKARRAWVLVTFDPDLGEGVARCALQLAGDSCHGIVDDKTLSLDRIDRAGTYRRDNIQPACVPCQNTQGALITNEARRAWFRYVEEAAARGIEWDGVI
jgi:5-methylcytosine-specific restriction endonuclease McrA